MLTGDAERRQETSASCLLRCFCQASNAPSSRQTARESSSGASLQITLSQARLAPSSFQRDSQLRHSPLPQPQDPNIRLLWAVIEQQHDKWNTCHLTQNTKCGGAWIWPPPYFYVICAFKSGAACYLGFMCFHSQTYLLHSSNRSRQIAFMCLLFFQKLSGGFFDVMAHTKNSDAKQHSY